MRLLLDTHVIIAIIDESLSTRYPRFSRFVDTRNSVLMASVASLWEMAIKSRINKLQLRIPPKLVPRYCGDVGIELIDVSASHVTAEIVADPHVRDPFDRLLLAQAQIEGLQLMTADAALIDHPLAFRPHD
jgi:PIN domain nuclease of toxin-antitoxin system